MSSDFQGLCGNGITFEVHVYQKMIVERRYQWILQVLVKVVGRCK